MRRNVKALAIICMFIIQFFSIGIVLISDEVKATAWNIEVVDSVGGIGSYTSTAIDSNNYPHIGYYDMTNSDLKYARWNGTDWNIENIDAAGNVGTATSIALDSNDYAHISYIDSSNYLLKYARWNGTDWNIESIDVIGILGMFTSLALDSNDYPRIAHYNDLYYTLNCAIWNGSGWNIEVVDSTGLVGWFPSIAIDSNDYSHIAYLDLDNFALKYARWNGSDWNLETVDASDMVGLTLSMALDSDDKPHIAYFDVTNYVLKYAKWTGIDWEFEIVDSSSWVGMYPSIALDSNDFPNIAYLDSWYSYLKYARWKGSSWSIETIDSAISVGGRPSIAIDSSDLVHISYFDDSNGDLRYARSLPNRPPETPTSITGPTKGKVGLPYTYITTTTDADDDLIKFTFDWDDGTTSESIYASSGFYAGYYHAWANPGTYYVKVRATDTNGASSDWSTPLVVTIIDKPGAPTNLTAMAGDEQVNLSWEAPDYNGGSPLTNYTIYRGSTSGGGELLTEIRNLLMFTDFNVTNGQKYYYTVKAKNEAGEGPPSNEVDATPVEPPNILPYCNITAPSSGETISQIYTITGNASDTDGTIHYVEVRIDNFGWSKANGNTSWSYDLDTPLLADGTHIIYARSYDGRNYSAIVNVTVTIQNAATASQESIVQQPWFWAIIILIAVIAALIVVLKRKKKGLDEEPRSIDADHDDESGASP